MANRVVLSQNGLKVSKPGFNALTAGALGLQFSSDWSAMGVYQTGTHVVNSWSGNSATDIRTITFNKTFASPPFCAFYLQGSDFISPLGFGNGFSFALDNDGSQNNIANLVAQVSSTGILVRAMFRKDMNPGLSVPTFSMRYFVFDNNL